MIRKIKIKRSKEPEYDLLEVIEKNGQRIGRVQLHEKYRSPAEKAKGRSSKRKSSYRLGGSAFTSVYYTGQKPQKGFNTHKG